MNNETIIFKCYHYIFLWCYFFYVCDYIFNISDIILYVHNFLAHISALKLFLYTLPMQSLYNVLLTATCCLGVK